MPLGPPFSGAALSAHVSVLGPPHSGAALSAHVSVLGPPHSGAALAIPVKSLGPPSSGLIVPVPSAPLRKTVGKSLGRAYGTTTDDQLLLSQVAGISTTAITAVFLFTPADSSVLIDLIVVRCTAATGITSPALVKVKVNETTLYPTQQMSGLDAANKRWVFPAGGGPGALVLPTQALNFYVTTPAVGTSQVISVDVFGHEL